MKQHGLSMIEILVTLTIVAFALLGLLGLQARALSYQKDSFDRKAAAELVSNLAERMRANHLGFGDGNYDNDFDDSAATPGVTACSPCTPDQLAIKDIDQWRIDLRRRIAGVLRTFSGPGDSRIRRHHRCVAGTAIRTRSRSGCSLRCNERRRSQHPEQLPVLSDSGAPMSRNFGLERRQLRSHGRTMIELIIAMAIGLVILMESDRCTCPPAVYRAPQRRPVPQRTQAAS